MSKYDPLWRWIRENGSDRFALRFEHIEQIACFGIDHSFLTYKKELADYGFQVKKISMKEQRVTFERVKPE